MSQQKKKNRKDISDRPKITPTNLVKDVYILLPFAYEVTSLSVALLIVVSIEHLKILKLYRVPRGRSSKLFCRVLNLSYTLQ